MEKRIINPSSLAEPVGHFERAVQIGPWLYISGTSALTNQKGDIFERHLVPDIASQTEQTMQNIRMVCEEAGCAMSDIYEIRFVIKHSEYFHIVDGIIRKHLPDKGFIAHGYPGDLLHPEMLIEIEANAYCRSISI